MLVCSLPMKSRKRLACDGMHLSLVPDITDTDFQNQNGRLGAFSWFSEVDFTLKQIWPGPRINQLTRKSAVSVSVVFIQFLSVGLHDCDDTSSLCSHILQVKDLAALFWWLHCWPLPPSLPTPSQNTHMDWDTDSKRPRQTPPPPTHTPHTHTPHDWSRGAVTKDLIL